MLNWQWPESNRYRRRLSVSNDVFVVVVVGVVRKRILLIVLLVAGHVSEIRHTLGAPLWHPTILIWWTNRIWHMLVGRVHRTMCPNGWNDTVVVDIAILVPIAMFATNWLPQRPCCHGWPIRPNN